MALTLNLGVIQQNYTFGKQSVTTGDVSGWLENRYHPMLVFYTINEDQVDKWLGDALEGAVETLLQTGHMPSPTSDVWASGTTKIEAAFKEFLSLGVMETLGYPGVPTQAALMGTNPRFKSGLNNVSQKDLAKAKKQGITITQGQRRPSFIYSGLYQSSFKAWVT